MEDNVGMTVIWALEQDHFDKSDMAWCRGLGITGTIDPLYSNTYFAGKSVTTQVCIGLRIRLKTTCKKQETMLKLKYGNRLIEVERSFQE